MRMLLFGKDGQVGWELQRALAPLGEVVALGRAEADLARPDTLAGIVADHRPDVIVNAAAYTAVDRAEEEPEVAQRINAESVGILAQQAAGREAILLHYSTDYVFDGEARTPYAEDAPTRPRSVYGLSKRGGEEAIVRSGCRHLLFRTSWVYSARGRNFLTRILELAGERDSLRIVADQRGAPTGAELIADVTALALRQFARGGESGFYHLTATGETTWFDYATHIVRRARELGAALKCSPEAIEPTTTAAFGAKASRPAYSVLDTRLLTAQFGLELPDWRMGVNRVIDELVGVNHDA